MIFQCLGFFIGFMFFLMWWKSPWQGRTFASRSNNCLLCLITNSSYWQEIWRSQKEQLLQGWPTIACYANLKWIKRNFTNTVQTHFLSFLCPLSRNNIFQSFTHAFLEYKLSFIKRGIKLIQHITYSVVCMLYFNLLLLW